jgi:hypothetical protein
MENRWLLLLTSALISAGSWRLALEFGESETYRNVEREFNKAAYETGIEFLYLMTNSGTWLLVGLGFSWVYPVALRLGWQRTLNWWLLVLVGSQLEFVFAIHLPHDQEGLSPVWDAIHSCVPLLPILLPGFAMVSRRTRVWMIIPASLSYLIVWLTRPPLDGAELYLLYIALALPYAAILIFGTDPIPKRGTEGENARSA